MRRCALAMVMSVLLATAVSACGGSSASGQVSSTVTTFLHAIAKGDGATACGELTSTVRSEFAGQLGGRAVSCTRLVTLLGQRLPAADKAKFEHATVSDVRVSGAHATAKVSGGIGKASTAGLSLVAGKWKIDSGVN